jgi:hypothetical protein
MGSKRNRLRSRHARMVQGFDAALQHAWGIIARQHLDCSRRDVELERLRADVATLAYRLEICSRLLSRCAERGKVEASVVAGIKGE